MESDVLLFLKSFSRRVSTSQYKLSLGRQIQKKENMLRKYLELWYRPKDRQLAIRRREKLATLYAFVTWNCFGILFYVLLKDKIPIEPEERRRALFDLTGSPGKLHVYQFQGTSLTNQFDMEKETFQELEEVEQ
ncbi:PREDICTED: uncharacterized protein LOC106740541 [Dinoponera quadriceps]|uniref:Uncharacterized protein LOC106740541 n=1 Tax=Dinoponera quadriceps TaxID=609295 RepID=A0A6P3WM97_DINQU|nr:PREDICTED: uncharacterized protein LOC106740541 [Dinoponera quadriceps]